MTARSPVGGRALLAMAMSALTGCVSLTVDPRALIYVPPHIRVQSLDCATAMKTVRAARALELAGEDKSVTPPASSQIRLLTWNIHKEEDEGWDRDLSDFARSSDVLLLQEVTLLAPIQDILHAAGLHWVLASSFIYDVTDIGVLTATRVAPIATCTLRTVEPLLRIPKSAVITWLPLAGTRQTLAVANVHAINFTLTLGAYQAQLDAIVEALRDHDGPLVLAGDFNTWSAPRENAVREAGARLGLAELTYPDDRRTRFLGNHVDHILVRGVTVVSVQAIAVQSSDHNPLEALLHVAPSQREGRIRLP